MEKELLQKFFRNRCTDQEIEEVYSWFQTPEGQEYLRQKTDKDMRRYADEENLLLYPEVPSDELFLRIARTKNKKNLSLKKNRWLAKAAVAVLIAGVMTGSYFFARPMAETNDSEIIQTRLIKTGTDQHRLVTLSDGTQIRLNSNSSIEVPERFSDDVRELTLTGEAWFNVSEDTSRPFIIMADRALITVLGTEFNVKIDNLARNIQVAVAEGRVSLNKETELNGRSAILTGNTYAIYNLDTHEILIENSLVENYLSWISGRLYFYNEPLWIVSRYLERIYNVEFRFGEEKFRELTLSQDLHRGDLESVLEIISQTLDLDYSYSGTTIWWTNRHNK